MMDGKTSSSQAGSREPLQPMAPEGTGYVSLGSALPRIDALAKVTGRARYAAEYPDDKLLYGVVVNAVPPRGRIVSIDAAAALAISGVVDVITHENRPKMRSLSLLYKDATAPGGSPFKPLYDDRIFYSGQPVALVLASSFEIARHAARLVIVHVDAQAHETHLLSSLEHARTPSRLKLGFVPPPKPRGDAEHALERARFSVDVEFHAGVEHHNPMEMHATTVLYGDDGHLTIHDKTQGSQNCRWVVSRAFGLPQRKVTVRNAFVGGAFGSGLRPNYNLLLATMGALKTRRSVRVVLTRQQMFTFGHRPETWQRVRLAADDSGQLQAVIHEAIAETSRREDYVEVVVNWSGQTYACDNVKLDYKVVELDQHSPMDMRAPGAAHGMHALEVAMDELAHASGIDPLQLRLRNYAHRDHAQDLPFSTKALRQCYELGAARFGWQDRERTSERRGPGHTSVGWGMATGTWDALQMFARVRATLSADGHLVVESAASDIGTGTYSVMAQIAAAELGLPLEHVTFRLGDSDLPVAPIEGGSSHVATVGSAIQGVCAKIRKALWQLARRHLPAFRGARLGDLEFAGGEIRIRESGVSASITTVLKDAGEAPIEKSYMLLPNMLKQRKFARATHSAVFVEVVVDEDLGTVRVTRVVSAVAAGRIINPVTARSQIIGGVVWGISQALHEETLSDHALGRFMNHSFGEYHIACNADIPEIDVLFVEEDDRVVSTLGAKGVGEIGIVGVSAAISNAIFNATGRRIRSTPITPDKILQAEHSVSGTLTPDTRPPPPP